MDTVHLIGAEDVRSAGNTMRAAADEMRNAASTIDGAGTGIIRAAEQITGAADNLVAALKDHETNMRAWLDDFRKTLAESAVGNLKP